MGLKSYASVRQQPEKPHDYVIIAGDWRMFMNEAGFGSGVEKVFNVDVERLHSEGVVSFNVT